MLETFGFDISNKRDFEPKGKRCKHCGAKLVDNKDGDWYCKNCDSYDEDELDKGGD